MTSKLLRPKRRNKAEDESYSALDKASSTIYLVGDITTKQASQFRQQLRTLERLKSKETILVELNSPGGDIEAGFAIIDSIELCKKPVTTRVMGQAASMAALILASGHKREALPRATIMVHEGTYYFRSTSSNLRVELAEAERIEKLCNDWLDQRTGKESGYWEKRHNRSNLYLTPEQALLENLIDTILKKAGT